MSIEQLLKAGGPREMDPHLKEGQTISDREYWRMEAQAAQTWHHLDAEEKATIRQRWLSPEVQKYYET